jgi:hypothetical protein
VPRSTAASWAAGSGRPGGVSDVHDAEEIRFCVALSAQENDSVENCLRMTPASTSGEAGTRASREAGPGATPVMTGAEDDGSNQACEAAHHVHDATACEVDHAVRARVALEQRLWVV